MGDAIRTKVNINNVGESIKSSRNRRLGKIAVSSLLLMLWILAVYGRTLSFDFVPYDDALNVTENPYFAISGSEHWLRFWIAPLHKLYIPVTYSLWAVIAKVSQVGISGDGYNVYSAVKFHGLNILLHLCNTLWVAAIIRKFLRREIYVFLGAALFALHPMQVEPVAWVTGLKDLLCASFALPAVYLVTKIGTDDRRFWLRSILATILFLLALLAKPAAIAVPLMVLVIAIFQKWPWHRVVALISIWGALSMPFVFLTWQSQSQQAAKVVPLTSRVFVMADAISFYSAKILLPIGLLIDYGATPEWVLQQTQVWFAAFFCVCLFFSLWHFRSSGYWLGIGIALAALSPVLGLIPFEFQSHSTVADRYMYIPMLGVALSFAWSLNRLPQLAASIAAAMLLGFSILAGMQVATWKSSDTLFSHTLSRNPGSLVAWQSLGAGYMASERWSDATKAFTSALALRPRFRDGIYNLGLAQERQGFYEPALEQFEKIINSGAPSAVALEGAARTASRLGQFEAAKNYLLKSEILFPGRAETARLMGDTMVSLKDFSAANRYYLEALNRQPNSFENQTIYADFLSDHGDPEAAVSAYHRAIAIDPNAVPPKINLGALLATLGRYPEAEQQIREGIRLDPRLATSYVNLGMVLERRGLLGDAAESYKAALAIESNRLDAREGLARVLGGKS